MSGFFPEDHFKRADYMSTVRDYLEFYTDDDDDEDDDEEDYYSESEMISIAFLARWQGESFSRRRDSMNLGGFFEEYSSLLKKARTG